MYIIEDIYMYYLLIYLLKYHSNRVWIKWLNTVALAPTGIIPAEKLKFIEWDLPNLSL